MILDKELSTEVTNGVNDEFGVLYSPDGLRLLSAPEDLVFYNIQEGTQVICDLAFATFETEDVDYQYIIDSGQTVWDFIECTSKLKAISIPNSVVSIGKNAFGYCEKLKTIFIPSGTRAKFEKFLPEWKEELIELPDGLNLKIVV